MREGSADYAVIPQENTLGGSVTGYMDALIAEKDVYVVGEVILPISQTLMALPGTDLGDIRTVCSHAQGLAQSDTWREAQLPDAAVKEMASTAAAARAMWRNPETNPSPPIAAPGAAELYGLAVLAENVQITDTNRTRFYVLSPSRMKEEGKAPTNAVFIASCEGPAASMTSSLNSPDRPGICRPARPPGRQPPGVPTTILSR